LRKALSLAKIPLQHIITDKSRPTILKSRIIAGSQHVVRVDREDRTEPPPPLMKQVIKQLKTFIPKSDVVIISDYGKGMVTKETASIVISLARKFKKFVAVDPKGADYSKYSRASIITPNLAEASLATGIKLIDDKSVIKAGKVLLKQTRTKYILITRGKDGMSLFSDKGVIHIPVIPREVFDITGAGDTVISTLSLAVAAGARTENAAILANAAASVVVGKIGTAPCYREELEEALEGHEPITRKIKLHQELSPIIKKLK
ncbi:unnamed protein product, partial [marine sediment metagenome]